MRSESDDRLAQREIYAQTFDRRFSGRHDLELSPPHPLSDGDGICVTDRSAAIDIRRLDPANTDDICAELERFVLQVACRVLRRIELVAFGRDVAREPRVLVVVDAIEVHANILDAD